MSSDAPGLERLKLLVERLLDADLLLETEGEALLQETEAARALITAGETEAGLKHVEHVADFTEALVRSDLLNRADGRAVIAAARTILSEDA